MNLARVVFVSAALAFALLLALRVPGRVDPEVHENYISALARLRTLDARLNETVLRGRLGITKSYDPLEQTLHATAEVHKQLRAVPGFLAADTCQQAITLIEESAAFQKARARNVERFATQDAALAASQRIVGPETVALAAHLEANGGRKVADLVRALRIEVLELVVARELGHHVAVEAAIDALHAGLIGWADQDDVNRAELLVTHVRRIERSREGVAALTAEVVTDAGMSRALAIDAVYTAGVEAARASWGRTVTALFVLAIVMLAAASADVIARLRAAARALGDTTAKLTTTLEQLQAEREKEKELAELKTRFVAMTSHEFRTPLSVISSSAELLQTYSEKWPVERRSEHLARIRKAVLGMAAMLDRILFIGKTEAGMLEFRPSSVALDRLCEEIAKAAEVADQGHRHVVADIAPEVGTAHADETLVRHTLENLLSNALKYSPEGAAVRLVVARSGDFVVCTVIDHGIGIPPEDQTRLFESFHRAKNALHITGTGLGLAVAKRSVELHGGSIEFTSVVGGGTTFTVRLRAEREHA